MFSDRAALRTFEANDVRLSYRDSGDPTGAPVVLLHGSGSDAATWDRFILRLTAVGYRCIALDLRGHASSARTEDYSLSSIRDDVLRLLEALALRNVTLIGHSVGGYAALAVALHTPERIGRLVLEDLAAPPRRAAAISATGLLRALGTAVGVLTRSRNYELRAVVSIIHQLSRPDSQWWGQLGGLHQQTLVISGGPSSCIPPQRLTEVTAAIPHARLTAISVGHRVHSLAPDRFATEVMAFLAEPFDNCLPVTDTHLHPTPADAPSSSAERRPSLTR
jgi:pimeloyl-ACP methyl ester carboxylesterase